jgi:predicted nucleotidyltransferase
MRKNGATMGYIFGSYARGTAGPLSDVDVAVTFPIGTDRIESDKNIESIRAELEYAYGRDKVDVLNIMEIRSPLLRYIILLGEGFLLFADDNLLKNKLVRYALNQYEDTKYLRTIQSHALKRLFA